MNVSVTPLTHKLMHCREIVSQRAHELACMGQVGSCEAFLKKLTIRCASLFM